MRQVKQAFKEIVTRAASDRALYEQVCVENKDATKTIQLQKAQVCELQHSVVTLRKQTVVLKQNQGPSEKEIKSLKDVAEQVQSKNKKLAAALEDSEVRFSRMNTELKERKRNGTRSKRATSRLQEKLETLRKQREESLGTKL